MFQLTFPPVNDTSHEISKLVLICFICRLPVHAESIAGVSVLIIFYSINFYAGQTHAAGQGAALLSFTSINPDVLNINSKCPVFWLKTSFLVGGQQWDILPRDMVYTADSMPLRSLTGQWHSSCSHGNQ